MLEDLLQNIEQEEIKERLLKENFDEVICYPGAGVDVYPCVLMEMADLKRLKIYKGKPIYIFCDPSFTEDETVPNSFLYSGFIKSALGKKHVDRNNMIELCKRSGLYGNAYSAWENVDELVQFKRVCLRGGQRGYYEELRIGNRECKILIFSFGVDELWHIFDEYSVPISGAFIWNQQSWSFNDEIVKCMKMLPNWIVQNRAMKNSIENIYDKFIYSRRNVDYICKYRGGVNDNLEQIGLYILQKKQQHDN